MIRGPAVLLALLLTLAGCDRSGTSPDAHPGISLRIITPSSQTGAFDEARVSVLQGASVVHRLTLQPGATGTIESVEPGTYTVAVEGLLNGTVDWYDKDQVRVTAGATARAEVTARSFVPVIQGVTGTLTEGAEARLTWTALGLADSYRVEWSTSPTFATVNSIQTAATLANIALNEPGVFYFRVRGINDLGSLGRPSTEEVSTTVLASSPMLGYTDVDAKTTACDRCHGDLQVRWETTAHASAWADLQSSGQAQAYCEACHSVSELGNVLMEEAGYTRSPEARFQDVQCESCHGPGQDHTASPSAAVDRPLAPLGVEADLSSGCGECHSGLHHPFVEQWTSSRHGPSGSAEPRSRQECRSCHEGRAALEALGVDSPYLEEGGSEPLPLTCAVCHDPHGNANAADLRFAVDDPDPQTNLCARCHDRLATPDLASSPQGVVPHAPSTALLLDDAGWVPPGAVIDRGRILVTHGSEGNERLCVTCHALAFEVFDEATQVLVPAIGHTFRAIPCVDEVGAPTVEDCELTPDVRDFQGCAVAGCHTAGSAAYSALFATARTIQLLAEELSRLLLQVDPNLEGEGGRIDAGDPVFTVAEGAFFNLKLAETGGSSRPGELLAYAAAATHNPFLVPELLRASIEAIEDEYGVTTTPRGSTSR